MHTVLKYSVPIFSKLSAISGVVTTQAIGCPFPIGFPIVTISGTTSCDSKAHILPTRPKPT